ncbi:MFS transporter [Thermoactinomyces mirandus]|uniref:MFS transporter n=1 Tax=Thermoactinomyces mirandus TaxID=2756294 RepID=A0A7W1XTP8_9BACL|nr:MFS transporter [Thermoactinomyces mirandus]MBA4603013.1 MFS transporter [Thermoactinomyces mirandus]
MNKKAIHSWVMYDWANSAYATIIMAAVMPIFYSEVAGKHLDSTTSTAYWGYTQSLSLMLVVLFSPVLGAIADSINGKKRFLRFFTILGVMATTCMFTIDEGEWLWASLLVILGTLAFSGANTFYDAFLSDIVPEHERDRISSRGFAFGYIGGGILLALDLCLIQFHNFFSFTKVQATQIAFLTVAIWWWVFSMPLFRHVQEKKRQPRHASPKQLTQRGIHSVIHTLKSIGKYPELLKFLIAFWFFSDGINTIIKMATIYGVEIGIGQTDLIAALLITQFVGIPCTLLFGKIASKWEAKPTLIFTLIIYLIIVILGYFMTTSIHFYLLAIMVGFVQGGSQALSRSIYSRLIPLKRNAEFFSFYSLSGKFAAILGPAVFGLVGQWMGSSRAGIASLALFFVIGIIMLAKVDVTKGKAESAAADTSHLVM